MDSSLQPVAGKRRPIKYTVESLAVIATVMGIATLLGLGVLQMNGLQALFGINNSIGTQMIIIVIMFAAYTGLDKGIRYLSNFNLGFALGLLVFVFITGPTLFILGTFTLALGDYLSNFIQYTFATVRWWNVGEFYRVWTIAWSPYVGAFVAHVSKGRMIREYLLGVMVVLPLIACLWIAVFGGTALW